MITIISGTNRPNSKSLTISNCYKQFIEEYSDEIVKVFSLEALPNVLLSSQIYDKSYTCSELEEIRNSYIVPASKWIFILPEYNGSFPGVMKLFIDALSINNYKSTFSKKKLALVGVSSGRSGNVRGIDHMTNCMHYLGTEVFYDKMPISRIEQLISDQTIKEELKDAIKQHTKKFLLF